MVQTDFDDHIDIILMIKDNTYNIILVPRSRMYDIDREYWETVVQPEKKGYSEQKILILDEGETFTAISAVISSLITDIKIYELIAPNDIIPALQYLSRFAHNSNYEIVINMRKTLTRMLIDLPLGEILRVWNESCAKFVDAEILYDKVRQWDDHCIGYGGWTILLSFPRLRPVYVDRAYQISTYCWFWIRVYEYGFIQKLPALPSDLAYEYWTDSPKRIHSAMRRAMIPLSTMSKMSACDIKNCIHSVSNIDVLQFCRIACSILRSLNCDEITSVMMCILSNFRSLYEKAECNLPLLFETAKNVLRGQYKDIDTPLSPLELSLVGTLKKISIDVWDVYMIGYSDRDKRLASLHPLSYSFVEDDSWYASYISIIPRMMRIPTTHLSSKTAIPVMNSL